MSQTPRLLCTGRRAFLVAGLASLAAPARALEFDDSWRPQGFPFRRATRYALEGETLGVASAGGVSLLLRKLGPDQWGLRRARWDWSVAEGVAPTDLTRKGGDDRSLALYFAFLPPERARALQGASERRVMTEASARTLVYVWGGDAPRGAVLQSPYLGTRGATIVLRPATERGAHSEEVDLARDHLNAFGLPAGALVGLAISADSDDTSGRIAARIGRLELSA